MIDQPPGELWASVSPSLFPWSERAGTCFVAVVYWTLLWWLALSGVLFTFILTSNAIIMIDHYLLLLSFLPPLPYRQETSTAVGEMHPVCPSPTSKLSSPQPQPPALYCLFTHVLKVPLNAQMGWIGFCNNNWASRGNPGGPQKGSDSPRTCSLKPAPG